MREDGRDCVVKSEGGYALLYNYQLLLLPRSMVYVGFTIPGTPNDGIISPVKIVFLDRLTALAHGLDRHSAVVCLN